MASYTFPQQSSLTHDALDVNLGGNSSTTVRAGYHPDTVVRATKAFYDGMTAQLSYLKTTTRVPFISNQKNLMGGAILTTVSTTTSQPIEIGYPGQGQYVYGVYFPAAFTSAMALSSSSSAWITSWVGQTNGGVNTRLIGMDAYSFVTNERDQSGLNIGVTQRSYITSSRNIQACQYGFFPAGIASAAMYNSSNLTTQNAASFYNGTASGGYITRTRNGFNTTVASTVLGTCGTTYGWYLPPKGIYVWSNNGDSFTLSAVAVNSLSGYTTTPSQISRTSCTVAPTADLYVSNALAWTTSGAIRLVITAGNYGGLLCSPNTGQYVMKVGYWNYV